MKGHLEILPSTSTLLHAVADTIVACLQQQIRSGGAATIALSGGTTPRGVYELLGSKEYRDRVEWKNVHLFWGDERCVGPAMPESNYRMANEALVRNIGIPSANVHRIHGEAQPAVAARDYETDIRRWFGLKEGEVPRFTLVLLGLGEDGHTASLFPGTRVLHENHRIVSEVFVESLNRFRVTLTFPAINNASTVLVLVSGRSKAEILKEVYTAVDERFPAQRIDPTSGRLLWLVDSEAASQLPNTGHA
jgi:6-phosphogluconolactonase